MGLKKARFQLNTALFCLGLSLAPALAQAEPLVCSNVLLEGPAGKPALDRFATALQLSIEASLKRLGWKKSNLRISVQNRPDAHHRVLPQYSVQVELVNGAILRNPTEWTTLKVTSNPIPENEECELEIQGLDGESLMNGDGTLVSLFIPILKIKKVIELQPKAAVLVSAVAAPRYQHARFKTRKKTGSRISTRNPNPSKI